MATLMEMIWNSAHLPQFNRKILEVFFHENFCEYFSGKLAYYACILPAIYPTSTKVLNGNL